MAIAHGKQRKSKPEALTRPIVCPRGAIRGPIWSPENKLDREQISKEFEAKFGALFDYYGVERPKELIDSGMFKSCAGFSQSTVALVDLVLRMASDAFPAAFEIVREGGDQRTKGRTWTASRRYELIIFFRHFLDRGLTQENAGQLYLELYKELNLTSAKAIAARYRSAWAWWSKRENITDTDRVDLLNYINDLTGTDRWNSDTQRPGPNDLDSARGILIQRFKQAVPNFPP